MDTQLTNNCELCLKMVIIYYYVILNVTLNELTFRIRQYTMLLIIM